MAGYSIPELLLLGILTPLFLATLIALLNFDWLNNAILDFHHWIVKKHSNTKSGILRFFLALFKYPGQVPQGVGHSGWKSGLTLFTSTFSTVAFGAVIAGIGIVAYYIVMIALIIAAVIAVLAVVGAILGGGK